MAPGLTHGSLFTGIGGFEYGLEAVGFETLWASEIDKWCNRVLDAKYPEVPNLGDITKVSRPARVDVLSFGSPCQDLSVAGRRAGLAGTRSGLFFEACRLIDECKPDFAVWENVPGGFTSNAGLDFRVVLDTLVGLGCRSVAWRVFDSRYFGVPQQRRRVYLVADFGGDRAAEVLFDPEGCCGHPSPFSPEGQGLAATLAAGAYRSGRPGGSHDTELVVAPTLRSGPPPGGPGHGKVNGSDRGPFVVETSKAVMARDGKGVAFRGPSLMGNYTLIQDARSGIASKRQNGAGVRNGDVAYTVDTLATQAVVFDPQQLTNKDNRSRGRKGESYSLNAKGQMTVAQGPMIRRFTPLECERLQAFPDGWTCLCGVDWSIDPGAAMFACSCPDGPRYRAIGNAVTTTVPRWIGHRIREVAYA